MPLSLNYIWNFEAAESKILKNSVTQEMTPGDCKHAKTCPT